MEGVLTMKTPRLSRRRRGSSFIEILVALALLAILMVGILQMYSLSLLTNFGSAARTDLLYKAQQVVENLRLVYSLEKLGNNTARVAAGVPFPIAATTGPIYLPYYIGDSTSLTWAYWGPSGANIVEQERLPYRLSYTVEDLDPIFWLVTVTATPVDNPNLSGTLPVPGANDRRFLGPGSKFKIVTYSAEIPK
jgi:prepilin-type N-terminal cleavage/methylation domain-containing protein